MLTLTKIIATIGPSTESEEMIAQMLHTGVSVIRFNFKHNSLEWHDKTIERVRKISSQLGKTVGILLDLQGPEIRIILSNEHISIGKDEIIELGLTAPDRKGFTVTHPEMVQYLHVGQQLVADDGALVFEVVGVKPKVLLKSVHTGELKNRKSICVPGTHFPLPLLTERDYEGLDLVKKHNLPFTALSYVRTPDDVMFLRKELKNRSIKTNIVSKIEAKIAVDNVDGIIEKSDAIMVARGDLGIEIPIERVPYWQKIIIGKCLEQSKPVITATQMLHSMTNNPFPTRAEISDVANATYDLTDAVMLSGESAFGSYPLQTIQMMQKTVSANEITFASDTRLTYHFEAESHEALICEAAYNLYLTLYKKNQKPNGFIVYTQSGKTVRLLARYRPAVPIFAFTAHKEKQEELMLTYGVNPFVHSEFSLNEKVQGGEFEKSAKKVCGLLNIPEGLFIVVVGDYWLVEGGTSTIKLLSYKENLH